jgi:hypothetical protein
MVPDGRTYVGLIERIERKEWTMKTVNKWMIVLAMAVTMVIGVTGVASAASKEVLVLYNGQTEVNRETYKFLMRNLNEANLGLTLKASSDTASIKPGTYKAIVVLNSGLATGTDPVLKAFVDKYTAKSEIFWVNLVAGSTDQTITTATAAKSGLGVDAVTAASKWSEGSDKMTWVKVHQAWIADLVTFLKAR